ncbi:MULTISPECIES: OsmC family protein [unclassified Marinovum]
MKTQVKWAGKRTFVGASDTGHTVAFGTAHDGDGLKPGPSPMELVLIGTGGCSAWDVVSILEKGRQNITDVVVELDADRAETDPKVFTRVHMHFIVTGRGIDPARVERAIALSVEKYCSASAVLAASATLTHDFDVIDTAAE